MGKPARFYLVPGVLAAYDRLYLDEETWSRLRDCGVFPGEYVVKVRLLRLRLRDPAGGERVLELYPYAEVATGARA